MSDSPADSPAFETIIYSVEPVSTDTTDDGQSAQNLASITINRPAKLNALNQHVLTELRDALQAALSDATVSVIIITGAGEKSFVAGADIAEFNGLTPIEARKLALAGQRLLNAIENSRKPVIAAVNGYALGGGCELAMACHMRFASSNALFGQPEVGLGLIPGYGGTQRLPRLVGPGRAAEMILTGKPISAERAAQIGLVNSVHEPEKLLTAVKKVARKISAQGPLAIELALAAMRAADGPIEAGLKHEAALFGEVFSTDDFQEGVRAFLEKRSPHFTGQ